VRNRKKRKGKITKEIVENRNNISSFIERFDVKVYLAEKA